MKSFKEIREACWKGYKAIGQKKKGNKMVPNCVPEEEEPQVKEDAPANAAGGGNIAGIGVGPDGEPGVLPRAAQKYKKKNKEDLKGRMTKFMSKFRTVEDYNKLEVENIINKINNSDDVYENQVEPIVKNLKRKKDNGTYNEEIGIKTFRYIVDNHTSNISEQVRNAAALILIDKYL
jgi:hypothetical protein